MSTKRAYYDDLVRRLSPCWEQDALMSEQHPETWQHARDLDDWLVEHRDDPAVTPNAYRLKYIALIRIYTPQQQEQGAAP